MQKIKIINKLKKKKGFDSMANKIRYGLENVHIAEIISTDINGVPTYGTPIPIKGAVNLDLTAQSTTNKFYADNTVYYTLTTNNGYEGTIEFALMPQEVRNIIFAEQADANGVIADGGQAQGKEVALLFQFLGDVEETRLCLYKCKFALPDISAETIEDNATPQTETFKFTATARLDNGITRIKVNNTSETATVYSTWFDAVPEWGNEE